MTDVIASAQTLENVGLALRFGLSLPSPPSLPADSLSKDVINAFLVDYVFARAGQLGQLSVAREFYAKVQVTDPFFGVVTVQNLQPYLKALLLLGLWCNQVGTYNVKHPLEFTSTLDIMANALCFPEKQMTWEGIAEVLNITACVIVESLICKPNEARDMEAFYWCHHYFEQTNDPKLGYFPGVNDWIKDNNGWDGLYYYVAGIVELCQEIGADQAPDEQDSSSCAKTSQGAEENKGDPAIAFGCNFEDQTIWCRVNSEKSKFDTMCELVSYLGKLHSGGDCKEQ